tara:strand:+ start:3998 stop:4363 length:366 start_codon:yes stop_codon:yes gene_type:complete
MSDTWDDGYEESLDDGHKFAERHLSLPDDSLPGEEGGQRFTWDDQRAEKLGGGVFVAMWDGICVVCREPFPAGDLITGKNVDGYRHAGCVGEQTFRTQYNKEQEEAENFLLKKASEEAEDF